jgi:peptidoglycan hydrolase CwlO-like protein
MTESIIVAIIAGGAAIGSNVIIASANNSKTIYRIDQLEKKVEKHNNLVERMYEVEKQNKILEKEIEDTSDKIDDLKHKIRE